MPTTRAEPVGERSTGVARIERRVGLDHVLDQAHGGAGAGRQRPPECRDDPRRDRAAEAVRAPDRDDELPDPQVLRVAELGRDDVTGIGAQDREVGERVRSDDLEGELAPVGERRAPAATGAGDDVGRAQHVAVGGDDDAAAGAAHPAPAPRLAGDGQMRDRGTEPRGDPGDGARVGIEGIRVRKLGAIGAFPSPRGLGF